MRILFSSHVFAPSIGGLERVSEMLAGELARQGIEVKLVTQTPGQGADAFPYEVHRCPDSRALLGLVRWCDLFFHNNISLPRAWPLLVVSRPWVVAHHVWIPRQGFGARLKRFALRYAKGIAISEAVARHLRTPSIVIPNPYDDETFRIIDGVPRQRDLVFVGRLVSDKGVDLLLDAIDRLRGSGIRPTLTIVGIGPEEARLRAQVRALELTQQVSFAGKVVGPELALLLNAHRIIVIPSTWNEPFGLVAIEGIACGCVAVGSSGGGLSDAIGACGVTFPNGSVEHLAGALHELLATPERLEGYRRGAAAHLRRHTRSAVAAEYVREFREALRA